MTTMMTVLSGRRGAFLTADMTAARDGQAGLSWWPAHDNHPTEVIEIGSLGAASPPIA